MEEKVSTARIALKYGVLASVVIMVFTTIINVTGQSQNKWLTSLSFVFMIVGIVVAMKSFKEENKGFMTYGEGLGLGSLVSAIMGLLGSTFSVLYNKFIDPTIITQAMDTARSEMESKGMDDAQIDQAMAMSEKFMSPGVLFAFGVIGSLMVGFVLSLIIAAILRKDKPVFD
ncbi:DUF4199 domain-containing protein [Dyadobacter sp. 32]|uniref:DUF4199 domain-containing protein n=1 Tax=Dyadobacter sp. 32 TaxID=538966 RepID=UPI0011EE4DA4